MSIIFSDNFNSGFNPAWTLTSGNGFGAFGCGGTLCLSCGSNMSLGPRLSFSPTRTQGAFRFLYAYYFDPASPSPDVGYLVTVYTFTASYRQVEALVYPDGHIQITSQSGSLNMSSPAGIILTNGIWQAIQITVKFYTVPAPPFGNNVAMDFQVIVNNSIVWNVVGAITGAFDYGVSPIPANWDGMSFLAREAISGANFSLVGIDNFEVDDSNAITTWNLCSPPPTTLFNNICAGIITPPTTGTITVTKASSPDSGSHSFSFTTVGGLSPSTFNLLTGQSQVFNSVAPGVYSIIENSDTAWNPVYSVSSGGTDNLNITIVAGSNIVVTVTNVPKPDISGLYAVIPIKTHDTYNGPVEKKIPNPTIKSALIGE